MLPKALKSCPKFNKSPNLVTLLAVDDLQSELIHSITKAQTEIGKNLIQFWIRDLMIQMNHYDYKRTLTFIIWTYSMLIEKSKNIFKQLRLILFSDN